MRKNVSNALAALTLAVAVAATVVLVYTNTPALPSEDMILNAINSTPSYNYTTSIHQFIHDANGNHSINQTVTGGRLGGLYYSKLSGGESKPPVMELIYTNGSLYVNRSWGGFIKVTISKKELRMVLSSMNLSNTIKSLMDNSTIISRARYRGGFRMVLRYNESRKERTRLGNLSYRIEGNVTMILDGRYRPTRMEIDLTGSASGIQEYRFKEKIVSNVSYSNKSPPLWVEKVLDDLSKSNTTTKH